MFLTAGTVLWALVYLQGMGHGGLFFAAPLLFTGGYLLRPDVVPKTFVVALWSCAFFLGWIVIDRSRHILPKLGLVLSALSIVLIPLILIAWRYVRERKGG